MIDEWVWWQIQYLMKGATFEVYLKENEALFEFSPILYRHMNELIQEHKLKGLKLNHVDVHYGDYSSTDQEYWYHGDNYLKPGQSTGMLSETFPSRFQTVFMMHIQKLMIRMIQIIL